MAIVVLWKKRGKRRVGRPVEGEFSQRGARNS